MAYNRDKLYESKVIDYFSKKHKLNIKYDEKNDLFEIDNIFYVEPLETVETNKSIRGNVEIEVTKYMLIGTKEVPPNYWEPGFIEEIDISVEKSLEDALKKILIVKLEEEINCSIDELAERFAMNDLQ